MLKDCKKPYYQCMAGKRRSMMASKPLIGSVFQLTSLVKTKYLNPRAMKKLKKLMVNKKTKSSSRYKISLLLYWKNQTKKKWRLTCSQSPF